jgi:hypothetical protein
MSFYRVGDHGIIYGPTGAQYVSFAEPSTALPLETRLVITGHSIPDNIAKGPLQGAITSMGGTSAIFGSTGPAASALFRWDNDPASPVAVRAAMEDPGSDYDAFLGIEGYGGSYEEGRKSVREHITWSSGHAQAVLWHNLAASAGCTDIFYANFWRDGVPNATPVFDSAWRAAQELEKPYWNALIDYVNANKSAGTPAMRLVCWLEVFCAVYDAIQAGTVTGIAAMADLFADHVHPETNAGRWLQIATVMAVIFRRHPDTVPAAAATNATISDALAAQLRPLVWATCLTTSRAGLSA